MQPEGFEPIIVIHYKIRGKVYICCILLAKYSVVLLWEIRLWM